MIPSELHANQGEQITFNISESTLPSTAEVYLEDNVPHTHTLLNSNAYSITPSSDLNGTSRFLVEHFVKCFIYKVK